MGQLSGDADLAGQQCRQFITSVLAADIERRPYAVAVLDVLLAGSVPLAAATRFIDAYDAAVWQPLRAAFADPPAGRQP